MLSVLTEVGVASGGERGVAVTEDADTLISMGLLSSGGVVGVGAVAGRGGGAGAGTLLSVYSKAKIKGLT